MEQDQAAGKSVRRHETNVRRRAGAFNAGARRCRFRAARTAAGLHPDWGIIGPFADGMHRNWWRKYMREAIRAGVKPDREWSDRIEQYRRAGRLGPPTSPFRDRQETA